MSRKVLIIGNSRITSSMSVEVIPVAGRSTFGKAVDCYPAGSAIDVSAAISRFGIESLILTRIGKDLNGMRIKQFLVNNGVDITRLVVDRNAPTGVDSVIIESDMQERRMIFNGANANLEISDVEDAFSAFPSAVIVNGDVRNEIAASALNMAFESEIPALLSIVGDYSGALSLESMRPVDLLLIDKQNTRRYTGISPDTVDSALRACIVLTSAMNINYCVIRLGRRGTFIYDGKYYNLITPPFMFPESDGASNSYFIAALYASYLIRGDLKSSCEYAATAESCCVRRSANAINFPTPDEVRKFANDNGITGGTQA